MTSEHTPIVDAILAALPDVKVPKGMHVGLKFTSPTQTTYGGYKWPEPGKWTPDPGDDWDKTLCAGGGGVHAALTIEAAQSGGGRYSHAMLVCWRPDEAVTDPNKPGKVKARRIKTLCRIDLARLIRQGALNGARLDGALLDGALLEGARLDGASLNGASLDGATLNSAWLEGASLNGASLHSAIANKWTRWPDGFDPVAAGVVIR